MKIDRRLMLIGVMIIVLSMTMATQYAVTKVGYTYSIVHPSDADIRFIGSDNGTDGRVLRSVNNGTTASVELYFGNWSANTNKTYTAAFGIVNEELSSVNITHVVVSNETGADYMQIWLHSNRSTNAINDGTKRMIWNKGDGLGYNSSTSAWVLGAGNQNSGDMSADGNTQLSTPWDGTKGVRFSVNDANASVSGTSDFVWVQISIDIASAPALGGNYNGTIEFHFKAET